MFPLELAAATSATGTAGGGGGDAAHNATPSLRSVRMRRASCELVMTSDLRPPSLQPYSITDNGALLRHKSSIGGASWGHWAGVLRLSKGAGAAGAGLGAQGRSGGLKAVPLWGLRPCAAAGARVCKWLAWLGGSLLGGSGTWQAGFRCPQTSSVPTWLTAAPSPQTARALPPSAASPRLPMLAGPTT